MLGLLRARVEEGSQPGSRGDGCKLGLVLEGGGMKGVVNGGALQALHDLGLRQVASWHPLQRLLIRAHNTLAY